MAPFPASPVGLVDPEGQGSKDFDPGFWGIRVPGEERSLESRAPGEGRLEPSGGVKFSPREVQTSPDNGCLVKTRRTRSPGARPATGNVTHTPRVAG